VTALFGPSGAGKSTVLAAIAGLIRPDFGRIAIGGEILLDTEQGKNLTPVQRRIGVMFQDLRLFPHLNVEANLFYGWRRASPRSSRQTADQLVELLQLRPLLQRRPRQLSGGEKSRVAAG
jgi:molybdate transport system ATP-binding protein